jgi:hypothetical protein
LSSLNHLSKSRFSLATYKALADLRKHFGTQLKMCATGSKAGPEYKFKKRTSQPLRNRVY